MTERITFSMPDEMAQDINAQLSYGDNRSEWIRDAIREKLARDGTEVVEKSRVREETALLDVARDAAPDGWNDEKVRSLAAGLAYLREQREATAGEIATAARREVPVMADESSWRSNVWNNVGKKLREDGVVELAERHTGTWRWVN
jgi:Arc/MetJ-type ribon-helix-helix transcriptional regulator